MSTHLVWLRNDLRLSDNPALSAACRAGDRVVALFIHEADTGLRAPGGAARWWLHRSLERLAKDLAKAGIALRVESGKSKDIVGAVARSLDAEGVLWNRRYAPAERELDAKIKAALRHDGHAVTSHPGNMLVEPWEIATGQGKPYSVFTPFWKSLREREIGQPMDAPRHRSKVKAEAGVDGTYVEPDWAGKLGQYWDIGETAARAKLETFLDDLVTDYPEGRDVPAKDVTSRLSPHLRFGEISARQIWYAALAFAHAHHGKASAVDKFLSELAWRDFSYYQLYHREDIASEPMQAKYGDFRWRHAPVQLRTWQTGQTGFPIIDAGMRQLWETGYMHNRVRMLVASFLSKNLLIDWREGERWFWDCLVDADIANNPASWQWVAGSGLDAAPYFRIFNPITQGERFDAEGAYVRRWVPELASLPDKYIQRPDAAPDEVLDEAGVKLGHTYPRPIIDLKATRQRALDAVAAL